MWQIFTGFFIGALSLGAHALTEQELKEILRDKYAGISAAKRAGEQFAKDYGVVTELGVTLLKAFRASDPSLQPAMNAVLSLINLRQEKGEKAANQSSARPKSPSHPAPASPTSGNHPPSPATQERIRREEIQRAEQEARAEAVARSQREAAQEKAQKKAAQRSDEEARAEAVARSQKEAADEKAQKKAAKQQAEDKKEIAQWLKHTLLIGEDRSAVAGFEGIANRLDVFNPLYGPNFANVPPGYPPVPLEQRKVFPNVPLVHQYDPNCSVGGGFFPLVIKLPALFFSQLPEHVRTHFNPAGHPNCELYWTVQDAGSVDATGRGAADNIIYRLQYWVQPSGAPIAFSADAHLLDPEGQPHHLPSVGYSIHDGVASPNAPLIPFQDRLRSTESVSFWSSASYGGRTAISCHWILGNGRDATELRKIINASATMDQLVHNLHHARRSFSKILMIDEIESVFGQQ